MKRFEKRARRVEELAAYDRVARPSDELLGRRVGRSGIPLGYRRFLADTAGGVLALASALWIFDVLGVLRIEQVLAPAGGGAPGLLAITVLVLLVATPTGLALTYASWFLLGGWSERDVARLAVDPAWRGSWLVAPTLVKYDVPGLTGRLGMTMENWAVRVRRVERSLERLPEIGLVEHLRGAHALLRSIVLLSAVTGSAHLAAWIIDRGEARASLLWASLLWLFGWGVYQICVLTLAYAHLHMLAHWDELAGISKTARIRGRLEAGNGQG